MDYHVILVDHQMDPTKIHRLFQDKLFSDITIILMDGENTITIDAHRMLLFGFSTYFGKLLTGFTEKHTDKILINVPNVRVASDIIASFYGVNIFDNFCDFHYLMAYIKCCDYWNVRYDRSLLDNLKIPAENFELFIDTIDIIGYDDAAIKVIMRNLPGGYDLSKFPNELVDKMLDFNLADYDIIYSRGKNMAVWNSVNNLAQDFGDLDTTNMNYFDINALHDLNYIHYSPNDNQIMTIYLNIIKQWDQNRNLVNQYHLSSGNIIDAAYLPNGKYIILISSRRHVIILDRDMQIFCEFSLVGLNEGNCMWQFYSSYSLDSKQFAFSAGSESIYVYDISDITKWILHRVINTSQDMLTCICYSPDGGQLISGDYLGDVRKWNVQTGKLMLVLNKGSGSPIRGITYSPNNQQLAFQVLNKIMISDVASGKLIDCLYNLHLITCTKYSPDSQHIITGDHSGSLIMWNLPNGTHRCIGKEEKIPGLCVTHFTNHDTAVLLKKYVDDKM